MVGASCSLVSIQRPSVHLLFELAGFKVIDEINPQRTILVSRGFRV